MLIIKVPQTTRLHYRMHPDGKVYPVRLTEENTAEFLKRPLGPVKTIQYLSRNTAYHAGYNPLSSRGASLFVQAAHESFADHVQFTLRPEVLWYMIVSEVATLVKLDPSKYARLFNGDPTNPTLIEVQDDSLVYNGSSDWGRSINLFREPLLDAMGPDMPQLLLPRFTTSTEESDVAILVTFMDLVSKYFMYKTSTLCHIPSFKIEGELEDWDLLGSHVKALSEVFLELKDYFKDLLSVIGQIYLTARNGVIDHNFWTSFYKYEDESGGPFISGWLTAFFAYKSTEEGLVLRDKFDWKSQKCNWKEGFSTNNFPTHVSKVPFIWNYYGAELKMAFIAGILGTENDEGGLCPRLGFGVIEPK